MKRISAAALAGLIGAVFCGLAAAGTSNSLLSRGDFPAFYAAAQAACAGQLAHLYDEASQAAMQNVFWPGLNGRYFSFAYPPYVAQFAAPLCALSPGAAKGAVTAIMVLCVWLCALCLQNSAPHLRQSLTSLFSFFILFSPVLVGVLAGQNNALLMLLYCGAAQRVASGAKNCDIQAGLLLGLMFYKPHYGLVALVLLISGGLARAAAGACVFPAAAYLISACALGFGWPLDYLHAAREFSLFDYAVNRHQMISLPGALYAFSSYFCPADAARLALFAGGALALLLLWTAIWLISRPAAESACLWKMQKLNRVLLLFGPTALIVSPHTMFYDLGLSLIPVVMLWRANTDRRITLVMIFLLLSYPLTAAKSAFIFQPFFFVVATAYIYVVYLVKTGKCGFLFNKLELGDGF